MYQVYSERPDEGGVYAAVILECSVNLSDEDRRDMRPGTTYTTDRKFALAFLVLEAERRADAKMIAELYVRPAPEFRLLFDALGFRVMEHNQLPAAFRPSVDEHNMRPMMLKRTDRYWTTRVPPISLPTYPGGFTAPDAVLV